MPLLFGRVRVEGPSMLPLLASGQRLLAGRLPYLLRRPARGDTVVVRHPRRPETLLVKRIVGVPGDRVALRAGRVVVERPPPVAVIPGAARDEHGGRTLSCDEYFVCGTGGDDSESFGPIRARGIWGKAWMRYWPPSQWGPLRRHRA